MARQGTPPVPLDPSLAPRSTALMRVGLDAQSLTLDVKVP